MQTRRHAGQTKLFLLTVVLPRVVGALMPAYMYLDSNGFRVDAQALQVRIASGVIGLLFLYTRTGRRLLFVGWLFMLVVIVANLKFIEFKWETLKLLAIWIAFGGVWFVHWRRVIGRLNRPKPAWTPKQRQQVRKRLIRESGVRST